MKKLLVYVTSLFLCFSSFAMFQEKNDELIEELFFGKFSPQKNSSYLKAFKEEKDNYNQSISSAALFLGSQLAQKGEKENASLAYAYAYYYDPFNEDIDCSKSFRSKVIKMKEEESKEAFINVLQNLILKDL